MKTLLQISRVIDAVNGWIGRWVAWLVLVAVIVSAANATTRKLFDMASNAWLELQWVLFSAVFLICAPWTALANAHIRIDILNNLLSRRTRHIIDLVGHALFLLPFTIVMIVTAVPFFWASFSINEQAFNAEGLPQWPAKGLLVIGFLLLFLQALSELIKCVAILRGDMADPHEDDDKIPLPEVAMAMAPTDEDETASVRPA